MEKNIQAIYNQGTIIIIIIGFSMHMNIKIQYHQKSYLKTGILKLSRNEQEKNKIKQYDGVDIPKQC